MKSEINMIGIYNNTSLPDPTTRLHYSPQGKTTRTARPVSGSTLGTAAVIPSDLVPSHHQLMACRARVVAE